MRSSAGLWKKGNRIHHKVKGIAMAPFSPEKLVIFDYSGTLSLEAPRFARPGNLLAALTESGLAKLGVATTKVFWGEIVVPTWIEGSTTAIGYKRIMAERVEAIGLTLGAARNEIAAATSRFVDLYLAHSRIDPLWRPVLENLAGHPDTQVVIATDHYAEATQTIIDNFHCWNIPTGNRRRPPFGQWQTTTDQKGELSPLFFCIANSADIGYWKADHRFWKTVQSELAITAIRSVLLIDDFGFNEERGDSYGKRAGVEARQQETAASIQEIFQTSLSVIPFFLKSEERDRKEAGAQRIAETVRLIDHFLNSGNVTKKAS
jgi:hypothetical protein